MTNDKWQMTNKSGNLKIIKRFGIWILFGFWILSLGFSAQAVYFDSMDAEGVSLKAGPTDMTEDLSIAWLESIVYPKNVESGKELFVEVKSTSKVKAVEAVFDFDSNPLKLFSDDQINWSRVYKIPRNVYSGAHVVRLEIEGLRGGKIQRTLDFAVGGDAGYFAQGGFPVSILKSALVIDDSGKVVEQLLSGVRVRALYRAPFYRVVLGDGREGWVEGVKIAEPAGELYLMGYKAFLEKDYLKALDCYKRVVELEPYNLKARFWLAKTYLKQGEENKALKHLEYVLKHDPENADAQILADDLALKYYSLSGDLVRFKKYKQAIMILKKVAILKPNSATTWLQIADLCKKSGDLEKSKEAYKQALRVDPINRKALAALGVRRDGLRVARSIGVSPKKTVIAKRQAVSKKKESFEKIAKIPPQGVATNSISVVKAAKTKKGTLVTSAISSVLKLTRSLGTQITEEGWKVVVAPGGYLVTFACLQERAGKTENEAFTWKVNVDSRKAVAINENAKLLMSRW